MGNLGAVVRPTPILPRPWGLLLDAATTIDAARWLGGVAFNSAGCLGPVSRYPADWCDYDRSDQWPEEEPGEIVTFDPFTVVFNQSCSTLGSTWDWLSDLNQTRAKVQASSQFASELADSVGGNPSLDGGTSLGSSLEPLTALAAVEGWLARRLLGGQGMIHLAPSAFVQLDANFTMIGDRWFSPNGHIVVSDAGYESDSVPFDTGRMYASGPVYVGYNEPRPLGNEWENMDFTRNISTARSAMEGIVIFDPCTAAYADYE